jgi:hypothetical protein
LKYAFRDRVARVEFEPAPDGVAVCVTFDTEASPPKSNSAKVGKRF